MPRAWTSSSEQLFHNLWSLWPANTVWPQCPVLPWDSPAHSTPSGFYSWSITFPSLCQASSWCSATNLHTDPRQQTQPSQGNPQLLWCGVPPRSQNRVHFWTQQALQVGLPSTLCSQENSKSYPSQRKAALQCSDWQAAGAEGIPEQPVWQRKRQQKFQLVKTERIIFTVWEQRKGFILRHFSQQFFKVFCLEPQAVGWPLHHREEKCLVAYQILNNGVSIQL